MVSKLKFWNSNNNFHHTLLIILGNFKYLTKLQSTIKKSPMDLGVVGSVVM